MLKKSCESEIIDILNNVFIFEGLETNYLKEISLCSSLIHIKKNYFLFNKNDNANFFYIIITGKLKIFNISPEGLEIIYHIHNPFDIIAEATIFGLKKYPASSVAIENSKLLKIDSKKFKNILVKNSLLTIRLLERYSKRLKEFNKRIFILSNPNIKKRIALYFLQNANIINDKIIVSLNFNKKDLASILGIQPETLSRNLNQFKKKQIIDEQDKHTIIIKDIKKLNDII